MSRALSFRFLDALYSPEMTEAIAALVTVAHPDITNGPLRYSSFNATLLSDDPLRYGTVSRGMTFDFLPMGVTLPEEGDDAQPVMQLVLDSVTREVTPLLAGTTTPAKVAIELVLSSYPDDVEVQFPEFDLTSAETDAGQAVVSLSVDNMVREPYPGDSFTPSAFGGLFATA